MLSPLYSFNLNRAVSSGLLVAGKFDGNTFSLAAVTTADKVFLYTPQQNESSLSSSLSTIKNKGRITSTSSSNDIRLININQTITSLAAGKLQPEGPDVLLVGTPTSLLVYNVADNTDLFYREVSDGANCSLIGYLGKRTSPLALIGGNCSLQGFDHLGQECFWTVTGDIVTSMALLDFNHDGFPELIVGSEDFEIRVFREDELISEVTETATVTALLPLMEDYIGYTLANGTVGVYKGADRLWRIKSKNKAVSIINFDLDSDGVPELITGWSNGKVDARLIQTGEVIFKAHMSHSVAGLVLADLARKGSNQLVVCSITGEIRGYTPRPPDQGADMMGGNFEQDTIRELSLKKQNLLLELHNYEENVKFGSNLEKNLKALSTDQQFGVIPAATQLKTHLEVNMGTETVAPHVDVVLQTTNDTVIRTVIIFAEGIFSGESHVSHPLESKLSGIIRIPLFPPRDLPVDLHIKAMIGYPGSPHFHVFEVNRPLPKFSMYTLCEDPVTLSTLDPPGGKVTFYLPSGIDLYKVRAWFDRHFLLPYELQQKDGNNLDLHFISLRTGNAFAFIVDPNGKTIIETDDVDLAGDIVQTLASDMGIEDLSSFADFPEETERLLVLMSRVEELQETRQKLFTDMADNTDLIKSLVVRAEDSRILTELDNMEHWYQELAAVNREMVQGYKIRSGNYQELMEALRQVNQTIQRASNLRVGRYKTQVVTDCRLAIKNKQPALLPRIISGEEEIIV